MSGKRCSPADTSETSREEQALNPRQTEKRGAANASTRHEPLAVIGVALRFPGANDEEQYWRVLIEGRDCITEAPADRWNADVLYDPTGQRMNSTVSKWGGFLSDVLRFDAAHFGISDEEAEYLDPQQRLLMELTERVLRDAAIDSKTQRTGVFVGAGRNDYHELVISQMAAGRQIPPTAAIGTMPNMLAARLSHHFQLCGPAMVVDTACSSSLVALHQARLSLLGGDCDMALVGCASLNLTATTYIGLSLAGALSTTGRCRTFNAAADGTVVSEGAAVLLVTRYADAMQQGRKILGIIRGSAVNNDGRTMTPMSPGLFGQKDVIERAMACADVTPAQVSYVEAHGTSTVIGDAVEVRALSRAMPPTGNGPRYLGSVKSNLGHMLGAAGMPALIKVLLAMRQGILPPSLHCKEPNPRLDLDRAGLRIVTSPTPWQVEGPRIAGVSSFGFGGTNAHVILEEPPAEVAAPLTNGGAPSKSRHAYRLDGGPNWATTRICAEVAPESRRNADWTDKVFVPEWSREDHGQRRTNAESPQRWLVASEECQLAALVNGRLRAGGCVCESVASPDELTRLATDEASHGPGVGLLYLDARTRSGPNIDPAEEAVTKILQLRAYLQRAVEEPVGGASCRVSEILVVTRNALMPGKHAVVSSASAALAAYARAAADERPHPRIRLLDLPRESDDESSAAWVVDELTVAEPQTLTALRDGKRWHAKLAEVDVSDASAAADVDPPVSDGCCVFVGGAGGIGAELAPVLLERFSHLVLVGRRATDDKLKALLTRLAQPGRSVEYISCDITAPAACERLVEQCILRHGSVSGLVHGAGDAGFGLITQVSEEHIRAILAAKTQGTRNLEAALDEYGQRPPLMLLFSSLASQLPKTGGGLAAYVAANAWLDAFAAARSAQGWPYRVINWGNFADAGMGANVQLIERLADSGVGSLSNDVGRALLRFALSSQTPQLVLADVKKHLSLVNAGVTQQPGRVAATDELRAPRAATVDKPWDASRTVAQGASALSTDPIEAALQQQVARRLGVDASAVSVDQHFTELGLDSLAAVDLVYALSDSSQTQLPVSLFFEYPTIRDLARFLAESGVVTDLDRLNHAEAPTPTRSGAEGGDRPATLETSETRMVPLSPAQDAFAKAALLFPQLPCFAAVRHVVGGPIDVGVANEALAYLTARHELLRGSLPGSAATELADHLVIAETFSPDIQVIPHVEDIQAAEDDFCNQPWSQQSAGLLRVALLHEKGTDRNHLLVVAHHVVADGWSLRGFFEEFWQIYTALKRGEEPKLSNMRTTFSAYVEATRNRSVNLDIAWWRNYLATGREHAFVLEDASVPDGTFGVVSRSIASENLTAFQEWAKRTDASPFALLLALTGRCACEWAGRQRIPLRIAHAGRSPRLPGISRTVGCFADAVPMLVDAGSSLEDAARAARIEWRRVREHLAISGAELLAMADRDMLRTPFGFSYIPIGWKLPSAVETLDGSARAGTAGMGLDLNVWQFRDELRVAFSYAGWRFDRATVERFADGWVEALMAAVWAAADNDSTTAEFPSKLVGGNGKLKDARASESRDRGSARELLTKFNRETHITPAPWTLHERIAQVASHQPFASAVCFGDQRITYAELNEQSDQFARHLVSLGVDSQMPVALCCPRSGELFVALLGILKAGGAYVYLSPEDPRKRHEALLDDAGIRVVVTVAQHAARFAKRTTVCLDGDDWRKGPFDVALPKVRPEHAAYVCYTSGSTGKPKGVLVEHRAVTRLTSMAEGVTFGPDDVFLQHSTLAFDASIFEVFTCLLNGATMVVAPPGPLSLDQLAETIQRFGVTATWMTSGLFSHMVEYELDNLGRLRVLMAGGDVLNMRHVRQAVRRWPQLRMMNGYGPTESNITTSHVVQDVDLEGDTVPIGRPLPGTQLCVLDQGGHPVGVGEIGELYVAGQCLARGYLHQPERTAEVFVDNPFDELPGERLYRTGDLVRWREDGVLLFEGRADQQVKIRGCRVEPGEVEHALEELSGVRNAAVIVRRDSDAGSVELVAFIEQDDGHPLGDPMERLAGILPSYMIPKQLHTLNRLPLNASGKVDRAQLAASLTDGCDCRLETGTDVDTCPPVTGGLTQTETLVAKAFSIVLGRTVDGRDADFFRLGGDSLGVIQLFAELRKEWSALPSVNTLYDHRTVGALATKLDDQEAAGGQDAKPSSDPTLFPLNASQSGFLLTRHADPDYPDAWSAVMSIEGELDLDRFQIAVQRVVDHQPMLRATFPSVHRGKQQVHPPQPIPPVLVEDLSDLSTDEQCVRIEQCQRDAEQALFDLEVLPLFRLTLLRLDACRYECVVSAHHLIGDAISVQVFVRDLSEIYASLDTDPDYRPAPLSATFCDAVAEQLQPSDDQPERVAHWKRVFSTPYHRPREWYPEDSDPSGGYSRVEITFSADQTEALRASARALDVSLFALVLDRLSHELASATQQQDLVIGVAHAGRDPRIADVMRIFGCFASSIPVRLAVDSRSETESIQRTAETLSAGLKHALSPRDLCRLFPQRLDPEVAVGSQFFVTFMDFVNLPDAAREQQRAALDFQLNPATAQMQLPPRLMDLHIEGHTEHQCLTLSLHGAARAFGWRRLEQFAASFKRELMSLIQSAAVAPPPRWEHAIESDSLEEPAEQKKCVDAALVGYLPPLSQILGALHGVRPDGLAAESEAFRGFLFGGKPCAMLEHLETPFGSSAFVCIPRFADELDRMDRSLLLEEVRAGIEYARTMGARAISLAGMLPSLSSYGHDLSAKRYGDMEDVVLTTGHTCTTISVMRQVLACLSRTGRAWRDESVAFVGLGSIGLSTLKLLLEEVGGPRQLSLCDQDTHLPHVWNEIERYRDVLNNVPVRAVNVKGLTEIVSSATLIIGAVSAANILDVDTLRSGTIVVDDSFPHCFDEQQAIRRMTSQGDVVITGGGLLACGEVRRNLTLPVADDIRSMISAAIPPFGVPSCQLESVLLARFPNLSPTVGLVDIASARLMAKTMPASIEAAACHVGVYEVPSACLEACRRRADQGSAALPSSGNAGDATSFRTSVS